MLELITLLLGIAFATVGLTGYVIFGPLTCRHLKDRGWDEVMDGSSFSIRGLRWIAAGRYRDHDDRMLHQLGVPARIMLWLTVAGLASILIRLALTQLN